jgi:hypothetical protein
MSHGQKHDNEVSLCLLNSWHDTSTTVLDVQADSLLDFWSDDDSRELASAKGAALPGFRA